jgi:phage terminase small subunit
MLGPVMPGDAGRGNGERPLTPKQARFIQEYLIDLNASQAARRAGYSAKSASDIGQQLLGKPHISRAIAERKRALAEQSAMSAAEVLSELAVLASSNVRHYTVDDRGKLRLADGVPDSAWRAVSSVKHKVRRSHQGDGKPPIVEHDVEYRLWNKNDALSALAKHFGLLVERHEVNITEHRLRAVGRLSDLELMEFLRALDNGEPERALKLLPGGAS